MSTQPNSTEEQIPLVEPDLSHQGVTAEDIEVVTTANPEPDDAPVDRTPSRDGSPRDPRQRINQKHALMRSAQGERDAALQAAETYRSQLQQMQERNRQLQEIATQAFSTTLEREIEQATSAYTAALQGADAGKATEAMNKLSELHAKKMVLANRPATPEAAAPAQSVIPTTADYPQRRDAWLAQNKTWFSVMGGMAANDATRKVLDVEKTLIQSGVVRGSPIYWNGIERAVSELRNPQRTATTVVNGSSRAASGGSPVPASSRSRTVELTEDQRRTAARLGLTDKEYALEVYKIDQRKK